MHGRRKDERDQAWRCPGLPDSHRFNASQPVSVHLIPRTMWWQRAPQTDCGHRASASACSHQKGLPGLCLGHSPILSHHWGLWLNQSGTAQVLLNNTYRVSLAPKVSV